MARVLVVEDDPTMAEVVVRALADDGHTAEIRGDGIQALIAAGAGEFVPRALERFTRPDASRSRSGAGLGLALVAALAQGAGGEVRLENAPTGLTVVVRIPACEPSHPSVSPLVRTGPIS